MKKHPAIIVAAIGLIIFGLAINSSAQSTNRLVADIPFDFYVGKNRLPSGRYEFAPANRSSYPGALTIRPLASSAHKSLIVIILADDPSRGHENPRITFSRYGTVHFLSRIDGGMSVPASRLSRSSYEKYVAGQLPKTSPVVISLTTAKRN